MSVLPVIANLQFHLPRVILPGLSDNIQRSYLSSLFFVEIFLIDSLEVRCLEVTDSIFFRAFLFCLVYLSWPCRLLELFGGLLECVSVGSLVRRIALPGSSISLRARPPFLCLLEKLRPVTTSMPLNCSVVHGPGVFFSPCNNPGATNPGWGSRDMSYRLSFLRASAKLPVLPPQLPPLSAPSNEDTRTIRCCSLLHRCPYSSWR